MNPFEYLLVRELVAWLDARLEHDARVEASALRRRLGALLPSVAHGLVAENAARRSSGRR